MRHFFFLHVVFQYGVLPVCGATVLSHDGIGIWPPHDGGITGSSLARHTETGTTVLVSRVQFDALGFGLSRHRLRQA